MKRAIATLCTIALAGIGASADATFSDPQQQQQRQKGPIRITTDLVSILASVTDAKGEPVIGLDQSAFQLKEEGITQKIVRFEPQTNRPLDLAVMLDASGSAAIELKIEREAAAHFIEEVVRPDDRLSVFSFAADVVQLSNFSADLKQLDSAVRRVDTSPDMGTSLYDAVVLGSQAVRRQGTERRRALVIITDAGETTSVSKFEDARRAAISSNILLYTVVVRPMKSDAGWNTAGEHAISTITDSVGGAMYYPTNLNELGAIFDRINQELRTQYLLGYYPNPTPPPGSDRHVAVTVNTGDTVRYRKEYFTGGAAQ
jgi:Ca-activated chloride channel family protein